MSLGCREPTPPGQVPDTAATIPPTVVACTNDCGRWSSIADTTAGRFASYEVAGNDIHVIGGTTSPSSPFAAPRSWVRALDVQSATWAAKAPLPTSTIFALSAAIGGRVYVVGGDKDGSNNGSSTLLTYDPATNAWAELPQLPTGRIGSGSEGAIAVLDGVMYVLQDSSRGLAAFDPALGAWSLRAQLPAAAGGAVLAATGGKLYAFGAGNVAHVYDPVTNSWTVRASSGSAHGGGSAAVIAGKIWLFGGESPFSLETYDPATDAWTSRPPLPDSALPLASMIATVGGQLHVLKYSGALFAFDAANNRWIAKTQSPFTAARGLVSFNGRLWAFHTGPSATFRYGDVAVFTP